MTTEEAIGWAVFVNDKIDMRTVGPTRRAAIVNWLYVDGGYEMPATISDLQIEALWEKDHREAPAAVAQVTIKRREP